jgi:hypothetical protein
MKQTAYFLINWLWIVAAHASIIRDVDAPPLALRETTGIHNLYLVFPGTAVKSVDWFKLITEQK